MNSSLFVFYKYRIVFIVLLSYIYISLSEYSVIMGQGCSDAGFCSISNFKAQVPNINDDTEKAFKNSFKAGLNYGWADHQIQISSPYIEYHRTFNKYFSAEAKMTTMLQSGKGITAFNVSDIYLNTHYSITNKLKMTLGFKIPLTNGNASKNGLSLPMDYQSSLGTFDLIFGLGYFIKNFHIAAAYQQPLTQNGNRFLTTLYPGNSPLRAFQNTNKFKRGADILLRLSYWMNLKKGFSITPGILPIFHISNDQFTDADKIQKSITGSRGLTLNGNIHMDYQWDKKQSLQLSIGAPFIIRTARPDGLTRKFVVSAEYILKF